MPVCKKCGVYFPNRVIIDNKERNLGSRKYCLCCSPFGRNNRKTLEKIQNDVCIICGKKLVGSQTHYCSKKCKNKSMWTIRRWRIKKKLIDLMGGKCEVCGYDKCMAALEFHHIDVNEKEFSLTNAYKKSEKEIKAEIKKCMLLCSNCHREIHNAKYLERLRENIYITVSNLTPCKLKIGGSNPPTGSKRGVNLMAEGEAPDFVAEVRFLHAPPEYMIIEAKQ